ncbi:MAG: glycosyltransferase family 8 protein [Eubacteriales bacterium]|nr:glycosyltransferase family 8 protein [Eubacteriales bacterium]
MHIVLNIDNNFIPHAAALIVSVLSNNKPCAARGNVTIQVLSNGVSEDNKQALISLAAKFGGIVVFSELDDFEDRLARLLGRKPETGKFSLTVLARIFATEYVPEDVEHFLYLDSDMIVRGDLSGLFSLMDDEKTAAESSESVAMAASEVMTSKGSSSASTVATAFDGASNDGDRCEQKKRYIIMAAAEPTIYEELVVSDRYFNSGMMLIDRRAWVEEDITKKCVDYYREHNGELSFVDQDILNHVLSGRVGYVSQRYNFQTNYHYQSYNSLIKRAPWYGEIENAEDYREAAKDPVIVHFAGDERPWIKGNHNPYRDDYYKYLDKTPWRDTPQVKGREGYMLFYHTVNVLSKTLPGFRTLVSRIYRKVGK